MKKWNDPKIALLVLAFCILFGTFFGGHRSLSQLRNQAELVYFEGELGDGLGIQNDLEELLKQTANMSTFARLNGSEDETVTSLTTAREALSSAESPKAQYAALQQLTQAVNTLNSQLSPTLSPDQTNSWAKLKAGYESTISILSHSPYNQTATQFNQTLSTFPASILGGLTGVDQLELFR